MDWKVKLKSQTPAIAKDNYKDIPSWIINHLIFFGNCGISYYRTLKMYQFEEIGMEVSNYKEGVLVLEEFDKKKFKKNYGGEFDEQFIDRRD